MSKYSRLEIAGFTALKKSREIGKKRSRDAFKKSDSDKKYISSPNSLKKHQSVWREFAKYATETGGIKRLNQVTPQLAQAFVQGRARTGGRSGSGASEKTLKGYVTGINKVMLGSKVWKEGLEYSKMSVNPTQKGMLKKMYKIENSDEWISNHSETYQNYQQAIDTIRAFGLRANELRTLNSNSFLTDNGKLYAQTVGKGGKYRIAECRSDLQDKMTNYYSQHIKDKDVTALKNSDNSAYVIRNAQKYPLKIKGYNSSKFAKHIFRAEYARKLLQEKFEEYGPGRIKTAYSAVKIDSDDTLIQKHVFEHDTGRSYYVPIKQVKTRDIQTTIAGYTGNLAAFRDVSEALGHNRLDVLLRYLK